MDVSTAFSVVYADDGSHHTVCWTAEETLAAIDQITGAGLKPVVFARSNAGAPSTTSITNIAPAGFSGVQAGFIHGGVRTR